MANVLFNLAGPGAIIGGASGVGDAAADIGSEVVVPIVVGRYRVKPPAIFNSRSATSETWHYQPSILDVNDAPMRGAAMVDVVLALGQLGITIQGVWRESEFVGLAWKAAVVASGTATISAGLAAGEKVTVAGVDFVAVASGATGNQFNVGANENAAAANLAAAITACATYPIQQLVEATASNNVVTVNARTGGVAGNAITLAKTGSHVSVSGAALANGADAAWTATPGNSVLKAIRRLMSVEDVGAYYTGSGAAPVYHPGVMTAGGHEIITGAASPWGKRWSAWPDTYVDITGAFPAWSYLAGGPCAGQGFFGIAHIRAERMALGGDGFQTKLPAIAVLVDGIGGSDANPSEVVHYILEQLLGVDPSNVVTDVGPDGRAESSYDAWLAAMTDLRVNGLITGTPREAIQQILDATCAELAYSEGKFKIWPLGDLPVGGYVPSQYDAGAAAWDPIVIDRNELAPGDIISCSMVEESQVFNAIPVRYKDKAKEFKEATYTWTDPDDRERRGLRRGPSVSNPWITSAKFASLFSQFLVKKSLNRRRRFSFTVSSRWIALEVGDLVILSDGVWNAGTQTFDDVLGVPGTLCRISLIVEKRDGTFEIEAWEWGSGATHPIDLTPEQPVRPANVTPVVTADIAAINAGLGARPIGGGNLLLNSSMELDSNADGMPDGWALYNNGGEACTPSVQSGGVYGGYFARLDWTTPNSQSRGWYTRATGLSVRGRAAGTQGGWRQGQWYTISWWMRANAAIAAASAGAWAAYNVNPSDEEVVSLPYLTTSWQRYVVRHRWTGSVPPNGEIYITYGGNVANGQLDIDGIQVEEGERETAYAPSELDAQDAAAGAQTSADTAQSTASSALSTALAAAVADLSNVSAGTITSTLIADNAITSGKIAANAVTAAKINVANLAAINADLGTVTAGVVQSSSYAEDGSGNPTNGWKGDSTGNALKVAPGNFQIGPFLFNSLIRMGSTSFTINDQTASITLSPAYPDTNYRVLMTVRDFSGTPAANSRVVTRITKATNGFTVLIAAAPGTGATVYWDWLVIHEFP